jgi:glycosyltransferase 2 family protein
VDRLRRSSVLRAVIGFAISAVAIAVVVNSVDMAATAQVLASTAPGWLAVAAAFLLVDVVVRAIRWRRLLAPVRDVPFARVLAYLLIGYLANSVLPARLGELVRCHYLGDREGISRATALGTVVVERVVDIVVVVAIAALAILVLSVRGIVVGAVLVGVAIALLLGVVLAIGVAAHRIPGADRAVALADRWPQVQRVAARLREGLAVAGRPRTLFEALALSVVAWGATLLAFAAAGQAIGVELTIGQASLLASGVALAAAIPSGPASLGTYELAATRLGQAVGVPAEAALAIGLLTHVLILAITGVGGLLALARVGFAPTATPEPERAAGATTD